MPQGKISRSRFVQSQSGVSRLRKRTNELAKKVFAKRNFRLGIKIAARHTRQIIISYTKTTTGEHNTYHVNPYSYRYRHTRNGIRKMLFAEDVAAHRIKGFVLRMIDHVEITQKRFAPKWKVEIE